MISKSLMRSFRATVFVLFGGIFFCACVTVSPVVPRQDDGVTPPSRSAGDITAAATPSRSSPISSAALTPTPTAVAYPDLKVSSVEPVTTGPYLKVLWSPDGTKALVGKD